MLFSVGLVESHVELVESYVGLAESVGLSSVGSLLSFSVRFSSVLYSSVRFGLVFRKRRTEQSTEH